MTIKFDDQGHLVGVTPAVLHKLIKERPSRLELVDRWMLNATPTVFSTFADYADFVSAVGAALHVHPRAVVVRGSCLLGFSTTPRADKAWRPMDGAPDGRLSDIDVAVADVDLFDRMDREVQEWERRNRRPPPNHPGQKAWNKRDTDRNFSCVSDRHLPPNTCEWHRRATATLDTTTFCGKNRDVNAYVYRDWWALSNRCAFDLRKLHEAVEAQEVVDPSAIADDGNGVDAGAKDEVAD